MIDFHAHQVHSKQGGGLVYGEIIDSQEHSNFPKKRLQIFRRIKFIL